MDRIPFGIDRLDSRIGGGVPTGSVVLLAGEAGAGAREFVYTSAVFNGLEVADPELFSLHYGDLHGDAIPPDGINYVSFTADANDLRGEIDYVMDRELVDGGLDPVEFTTFSSEYFQLSPVPQGWYAEKNRTIKDIGRTGDSRGVLEAFADYLDERAMGSLVLVDALTDLLEAGREAVQFSDIVLLLKGLRHVSREWDGVVVFLLQKDAVTDRQLGSLMTAVDGTIQFEWETGGNERVRTMFVNEFRGVLSRLEAEDIIRFETEIHDAGFDVSGVRKIR
ncbi:RAD55 family ATPase [Halanaeroarchaeum sulfurireducens]|uniref:RecA-superfamily ATPase n=1 Tax=Halanaeroarchaeum sulfurireducens TaxID=1604004 RepID=A0A0F7PFH8_9EURY|nr:HTR-like protein [Halanaeroarchaeum sulfurireducens]AKH98284.1 RecA-superfamily ATPase [Halanaeroarchaeum sulfurireducens]